MLEHFKKSDHEFVIRAKDWVNQVVVKEQVKITKFLTPYEQQILRSFVNQNQGIDVLFVGGFPNSERNRGIIFPGYMKAQKAEQKVAGFQIKYNEKLSKLEHQQVLGSLMALKIDRSIIGDIAILETGEIYFAVCEEYSDFLIDNFTMVGRNIITLVAVNLQAIVKCEQYLGLEIMISSMRLDVIVAALMNASRAQAGAYLKQGFVKLNHQVNKNQTQICKIKDVISIKRYGRYEIMEQKKITKKQKIVIVVRKAI